MISESQIILRLLIAAGLGLVIGYERERQDHAAGLRTHMILVVGAALAMAISINVATVLGGQNRAGDPARIAAQVVSGIGFLGGGVIFRFGANIRGLTTAASLWTVTIVGLTVGAGLFWAGIAATALILFILTLLNYFEEHFLSTYNRIHLELQAVYRQSLVEDVKKTMEHIKGKLGMLNITRDLSGNKITLDILVRVPSKEQVENVVDSLASIPGMNQVKISE